MLDKSISCKLSTNIRLLLPMWGKKNFTNVLIVCDISFFFFFLLTKKMKGETKAKAYLATMLLKGRGVEHSNEAKKEAKKYAIRLLKESKNEYWRSAENLAV